MVWHMLLIIQVQNAPSCIRPALSTLPTSVSNRNRRSHVSNLVTDHVTTRLCNNSCPPSPPSSPSGGIKSTMWLSPFWARHNERNFMYLSITNRRCIFDRSVLSFSPSSGTGRFRRVWSSLEWRTQAVCGERVDRRTRTGDYLTYRRQPQQQKPDHEITGSHHLQE